MSIAELLQSHGYVAVAVGTFLEGETVLFLAGAAASRGHLSLPVIIAVATAGSCAGDQLGFALGRRYGGRLLARFPSLEARTARVRGLLQRHRVLATVSVRFLYGLRVAGPIAMGMSGLGWRRFLALNLASALVWACAVAALGYGAGRALTHLLGAHAADEAWGLALLVLAGALVWGLARRRKAGLPAP